ncbi:MAG: AMP-binding protein [Desulfobacterales bacterium]|nr:AMP-binding protein [Desulfobacterales bacterium]
MSKPWLKQYEPRVPHALVYPQVPLHRFLLDTVDQHPEYTAITFNETHISYQELNQKVNRFARALLEAGVARGDRVALILVNSPTYPIAFFALMKLGAVAVNLSVGIQGEELADCLNNAGARVVVTLDLFAQNLYKVIADTAVRTVILHSVFGLEKQLPPSGPRPHLFQEFMDRAQDAGEPSVPVSPADVAVLQYTSGSTGAPKAATLTHANLVASVMQADAWVGRSGAGNAAVICIIPFFHVFGLSACLLISVLKGYRMVLMPRIDAMDIVSLAKNIEVYRPISLPLVPSLWSALLAMPAATAAGRLASVEVATSGGAPLPAQVHDAYEALTGRRIMEAYGLSEASSTTHITPFPSGGPRQSIGLPVPDTEARIVDLEAGLRECPTGEVGELTVKGPQIMQGYWNNAALTATSLRDGWLRTGDLARMDEQGFFYLVDRKDDMIITSGFNVYPSQIEAVLRRHPKVKDVGVIGRPDPVKGQTIIAVIALTEGATGTREEFLQYCKENMPAYRVPRAILFRETIPRDPAGKMLKRILRQEG